MTMMDDNCLADVRCLLKQRYALFCLKLIFSTMDVSTIWTC